MIMNKTLRVIRHRNPPFCNQKCLSSHKGTWPTMFFSMKIYFSIFNVYINLKRYRQLSSLKRDTVLIFPCYVNRAGVVVYTWNRFVFNRFFYLQVYCLYNLAVSSVDTSYFVLRNAFISCKQQARALVYIAKTSWQMMAKVLLTIRNTLVKHYKY